MPSFFIILVINIFNQLILSGFSASGFFLKFFDAF